MLVPSPLHIQLYLEIWLASVGRTSELRTSGNPPPFETNYRPPDSQVRECPVEKES